MANTYDFSAIVKTLCETGVKNMQSVLAPLPAYTTPLEMVDEGRKYFDSEVPIVTAAQAVQVVAKGSNADYTLSGLTINPVNCVHNLFVQSFNLENNILQSGGRVKWAAGFCARQLANAISDATKSNLTIANFGNPVVTAAPGAWTQGNFSTLAAAISTPTRSLILDTAYAMATPQLWTPASGNCDIFECSRWSTADANVRGAVASPEALIVRWGIPELVGPRIPTPVATEVADLPMLGIKMQTSAWLALDSRTVSCAYSLFFAAAPGDTSALKLLTSA